MPRLMGQILVTLLLGLLAGCAAPQLAPDAKPDKLKDKAIVVLSVSHTLEGGASSRFLVYMDRDRGGISAPLESIGSEFTRGPNELGDRQGKLYLLPVEPGTHEISDWQVVSGNSRFTSRVQALKFTVQPGEVIYLGNLNARLDLVEPSPLMKDVAKSILFFMPERRVLLTRDARPWIEDQSELDIARAEARAPQLKGRIRKALLPLGPWSGDGKTTSRTMPISGVPLPKK